MCGRPKKEDARNLQYRIRLNEQEDRMLAYASKLMGKQKSEIFRRSLEDYYNKIRINENIIGGEGGEWEMEHISLKRIIDCPYCGADNRIDFRDDCVKESEERQMGEEIIYRFDLEEYTCQSCKRPFRVSGYICEYPVGAYNDEDIKVAKLLFRK